ncbi:MAG: protein kinase [Kofleriaceae bacterium]
MDPLASALTSPRSDRSREGTTDGRYTLRAEVARGGMGRIWSANDARLSRRVAIKELLEPSAAQQARFERELSLTSRLEHPSIVSLYDGGTWPDGTPFYVMKLVTGESLDQVIARTTSATERLALLPRGIAVCEAIAYAHAQRIIHRDLKPANVVLGEYGETVVIDWGLAKDLDAAGPELPDAVYVAGGSVSGTVGGQVLGTPAYMPPEQALGDEVDERADVYALGAMLDHLLSGTPAYRGTSIDDVLATVIREPPRPLATREPAVPSDLVAIVEKAMARRPEHRYANAGELAADLKRFHSGQLVGAHRYTGSQLLWRWLRRHRGVVVVAAAATIALAALGIVSFTRIVDEEREARYARAAAEQHQRDAEDNHAKAEKLATFMLVDLSDKLKPIGKLDLLEGVALEARNYYHDQAAANTVDEQHRRAMALHGLGQVLAEKGDAAAALVEYQEALAIYQRLAASDPKWRPSLAESHARIGHALHTTGDGKAAISAFQSAIAIDEQLVAAAPTNEVTLTHLANLYRELGDCYWLILRDLTSSLHEQQRALELRKRLVAMAPTDAYRQLEAAESHVHVAELLVEQGELSSGRAEYQQALDLAKVVTARDPTDGRSQNLLADCHESLGNLHHNQGEVAIALAHYREALPIRERLVAKDPANARWRTMLASSHLATGQALDEQRDLPGALEHHRAAAKQMEELMKITPSSASNRYVLNAHATAQRLTGQVLLKLGRLDAAISVLETSRATTEQLAAADPANATWQQNLALIYDPLADTLMERNDVAGALVLRRKKVELAENTLALDPKNMEAEVVVVDAIRQLAWTLDVSGQRDEARSMFDRALAQAEALLTRAPSNDRIADTVNGLRTQAATCCNSSRAKRTASRSKPGPRP